jgi:hypothetical protein
MQGGTMVLHIPLVFRNLSKKKNCSCSASRQEVADKLNFRFSQPTQMKLTSMALGNAIQYVGNDVRDDCSHDAVNLIGVVIM